ncbi:winged helix-turn-helix domain-containing protein [Vibrio apostichopi]|uniref:winged helix-turn-helix domain-containing protein n=1 Tax=Vibrio apostichopi TaxID=3035453 RepID=UPI00257311DB|nr:winged helix-turn-helix domain-containing protein [Vibrio sp. FE10]
MLEKNSCFSVDEWLFIPNEGQILFANKTVTIDKRLTKLLEFLCLNPGQTHTRDELIDNVWSGMILTDQAVFELRKVLKQNSEQHNSYIITVPKRGYKFEADVIQSKIETEQAAEPISIDNSAQSSPSAAVPTPEIPTKETKPNKRNLMIGLLLGTIVVLESGYILYSASNKAGSIDSPPTTQLRHYEFRYVVLEISDDVRNDPVLYGTVTKFIEYVSAYSGIRIVHSEPLQKIAAIKLTFGTSPSRDGKHTRLTMRYHNNISDRSHLNRRYPTELPELHHTLYRMVDDVLDSLYIKVPKEEITESISQLPTEPEALKYTLSGLGVLYNRAELPMVMDYFEKAQELDPSNDFVFVANYIGKIMNTFYASSGSKKQAIAQLNQDAKPRLERLLAEGKLARAYDANAIIALSEDDPEKAMKILLSMPPQNQSILTYLLLAKAEESRGNASAAKELYIKATQGNSSLKAIQLASPLFFDSNLEPLLKELE